nr:MAG TPA: hypothetical protein [Caudoviricetes sp.]
MKYVHSGAVNQSLSSARIRSSSIISFSVARRTAGFSSCSAAPQSGQRSESDLLSKQ